MALESDPGSILDLVRSRAARTPHAAALYRQAGRKWEAVTFIKLLESVDAAMRALRREGLVTGDRFAIRSRTRVEWLVLELACMGCGIVVVGIDVHATDAQVTHVLEDSRASGLMVDEPAMLERLAAVLLPPALVILIRSEYPSDRGHGTSDRRFVEWQEFLSGGPPAPQSSAPGDSGSGVSRGFASSEPADLPATLLYTSGTTGPSKGILYRQHQLVLACGAILKAFPSLAVTSGRTICWLPMAALFQRMMNYVALASGVTIYFLEEPRLVLDVAKQVRPTYFIAVPRLFERIYAAVNADLAALPKWLSALLAGVVTAESSRNPFARVLTHLLGKKIRGVLGGQVQFVISGSAPMPRFMLEYFDRFGVLILEAYGLSEDAVPIACNRPDAYRFGSVGAVFPDNEIRLADDGEILVRGRGLMDGYWSRGRLDRCPLTFDGFFATGDIGEVDEDGYLYLNGRKSDLFKTSSGRQVSPSHIESNYRKIAYIEEMFVFGHGRPYVAALIRINERLFAASRGTSLAANAKPTARELHARVEADLESAGAGLLTHERIRRFAIVDRSFSVERGELTTTLKMRREVIQRNFSDLIEALYGSE